MANKNIISLAINNTSDKYVFRPYGICNSGASEEIKLVTFTKGINFVLAPGATVLVKFNYGNIGPDYSESNNVRKKLMLNVNNTGSYPIISHNKEITNYDQYNDNNELIFSLKQNSKIGSPKELKGIVNGEKTFNQIDVIDRYVDYSLYWEVGDVIEFVFDGSSWIMIGKTYFAGEGIKLGSKDENKKMLTFNLKPADVNEYGGIRVLNVIEDSLYDKFDKGFVNSTGEPELEDVLNNGINGHYFLQRDSNGRGFVKVPQIKQTEFSAGDGIKISNNKISIDSNYLNNAYATKNDLNNYVLKSGDIMSGSLTATTFYETSDERLKNFGNDIEIDFNKLINLKKKYFTWKDDDLKTEIGVSAQEIAKLYPEIVSENENGVLSVDYGKLSVIALSAIDKLYVENKNLEKRIENIENILQKLK